MTSPDDRLHQRQQWGLEALEADPRNLGTIDPLDAWIQRNGHEAVTPLPAEADPPAFRPLDLIVDIGTYRASVPTEIPWRCQPLAYSGGVTLIAGPPKAGKSTLAAQLQRCSETGADFAAAWTVEPGPCLLVTEEGGAAVVHKTGDLERLDVLDRRTALMAGLKFPQVLEVVSDWSTGHPGGMAFIDTLAIWAEIENENDASEASKAVAAVTSLAQTTDLAVVLIHHARKSGGDNGEAIRGSGAILATVDIAVELSRVSPTSDSRWLDVQGRVILPDRHLLGFDRATLSYVLEDKAGARLEEIEADLVGVPVDGPGMTRTELTLHWNKDSRRRSAQLIELGRMRSEMVQSGRGTGLRFWAIAAAWTPPLEVDR